MKVKWMCAAATAALLIGSIGTNAQVPAEKEREPGATMQQGSPATGARQDRQTAPRDGTARDSQGAGDAKPETAQDKADGDAKQSGAQKTPATRSTQSKDEDGKAATRKDDGKDAKSSAQSGSGAKSKDTAQSRDDKNKDTAGARDKSDRGRAGKEDDFGRSASGQSSDRQTTRESDSQDRAGAKSGEVTGSIQVTERERTTIQKSVDIERARVDVDIDVDIGATLPRSVELHPLPAAIIDVNPRWRSYRYVVVRNEIVIINPQTYTVVEVIPVSGSRQARVSGGARASVQLSTQQRQRILTYARAECQSVLSEPGFQVGVGVRIPERIELCPFEDVIIQEVGVVQPYRFFVVENQVVLVDPSTHTIVEVVR